MLLKISSIIRFGVFICLLPPIGNTAVCAQHPPAQEEQPQKPVSKKLEIPPWAEVLTVNAVDHSGPIKGDDRDFDAAFGGLPHLTKSNAGPSSGLQVNLGTGMECYLPRKDIEVYNPLGSNIPFQRCFRSDRALEGYSSPGLSPGWVHNFDITISPIKSSETWSQLSIVYPSGARDFCKPVLDADGKPNGDFQTANSAPFVVKGVPSDSLNEWQKLSITWRDRTPWVFTPFTHNLYVLTQSENLTFSWNKDRSLSIMSDTASGKILLKMSYDINGQLTLAEDNLGRKISYFFGPAPNTNSKKPVLLLVSNLFTTEKNPDILYSFTYSLDAGKTMLESITVPNPSGQGISTAKILYNDGKVAAHIDANGNQHVYTYVEGHTRVDVQGPDGQTALFWICNFDEFGRNIGTTDAAGNTSKIGYGTRKIAPPTVR